MTNILFWANEAFPYFLFLYIQLHPGRRYRDGSTPIGLEYIRRP